MVLKRIRKVMEWMGWVVFILLALNGLFSALGSGSFLEVSVGLAQENIQETEENPRASVPLYLDYEGYLTDMDGDPLTGYYTITLRIYADVAAPIGEELWAETHPNTPVRDGRFSVLLGNNTALPESLFDLPDRFIGATVAPFDELVPRQRLASVPYAFHADHAASLNAPDGLPTDAVFVNNEGNVGVGTTDPLQKLHVYGNTFLEGNLFLEENLGIGVTSPQSSLDIAGTVNVIAGGITALNVSNNGNIFLAGSVGIGTSSPQAKLDVEGNLNFTGQKACRVTDLVGLWVDTLFVPAGWTVSLCDDYFHHVVINGGTYKLMCIFEDGYSFGANGGGIPNPNCGW